MRTDNCDKVWSDRDGLVKYPGGVRTLDCWSLKMLI